MKAQDLVNSFVSSAKWDKYKTSEGLYVRGEKWITARQANFLQSLVHQETGESYITNMIFDYNKTYTVEICRAASNGCRNIKIRIRPEFDK